jgi:peptidyl-prolyl cis-trans isomerase C
LPRRALFSLGLAAVALSALAACTRPRNDGGDPVILSLGDETIHRSEFERHLQAVESRGGPIGPDVRAALLEPYLEERVLVLEARQRGLVAPGAGDDAEQGAVRKMLSERVLGGVRVEEAELVAHCQAHRKDFDVPERVKLRQILVTTSNEARDIKRRVRKDPKLFALLAQTRSRAPEASKGGEMGVFARGELPAELERAAFALAQGETSEVVESPLGFHVLRVEERTASREASMEECREAARPGLLRKKADETVRTFVRDLMSRARVNHEVVETDRR